MDARELAGPAAPATRSWNRMRREEAIAGLLFVAPVVIATLVLDILPMLPSLYWSFTQWDFLNAPQWVGLGTYASLFQGVQALRFWETVRDTTLYTVFAVPGSMVAGLALALLVNRKIGAIGLFRGLYYLPVITSGVALSYAWKWVFDVRFGIINVALRSIGLSGVPWLQQSWAFLAAIVIVTIWAQMGYNMILFLAGLQSVPASILEAASIDGAGAWQRFRSIILPLLTPTIFFVLILSIISFFQQFTLVYIFGTSRLEIYAVRLWEYAFNEHHAGEASAMAWMLFVFLGALTFIQWQSQDRWVHYD